MPYFRGGKRIVVQYRKHAPEVCSFGFLTLGGGLQCRACTPQSADPECDGSSPWRGLRKVVHERSAFEALFERDVIGLMELRNFISG